MSKTVKVRIPVAVNAKGSWCVGCQDDEWCEHDGWASTDEHADNQSMRPFSIVWITAEVPIPEPVVIEGRVGE